MRKGCSFCLVLALLLSLACGAGAQGSAEEAPGGRLFLTVSRIDLSVVGESEDIYAGTAPRENVQWQSDDEKVVTVRDGVLTATGVGTTTVRAQLGEETRECTVGCLAQTQEELMALDEEVIRSPKRYPPEPEGSYTDFFRDSAIVGDSITYIMYQYETPHGLLGHPLFLARGGTSLNGFVLHYKNVFYQGQEMWLETAVGLSKVKKVFIMLGQNDLGYRTIDETFDSWDILLPRLREQNPDLEIYLQSCVAEWQPTFGDGKKNQTIRQYNARLKTYAQEHGCYFVDIAPYAEDHIGAMATPYSMDRTIHLNEDGCVAWMKALAAYANWQMSNEKE